MKPFMTKTALDFLKVYLITDRTLLPRHQFLQGIEYALEGGVRAVQLREKDLKKEEMLALAKMFRSNNNGKTTQLADRIYEDLIAKYPDQAAGNADASVCDDAQAAPRE